MRKKREAVEGSFAKAGDDEMLFVLRAQDKTAPLVILEWMKINFFTCPPSKLREAFDCLMEMRSHEGTKVPD